MGCNCSGFKVVTNAVGAVARAAKALAVGEELLVTPTQRKARLDVCLMCEHFQPATSKLMPTCELCGCLVKAKAWLATESCPDNRWAQQLPSPPLQ